MGKSVKVSGWETSPGWEAEAVGAPHPAVRDMGKAGFSISTGKGAWERWEQAVLTGRCQRDRVMESWKGLG